MQDTSTEKLRAPEGLQVGRVHREYIVYTQDAGHRHGEAQGPGGPPGGKSTLEVREYIVYTPDAGHQHGEAQDPGGPPGGQSTQEIHSVHSRCRTPARRRSGSRRASRWAEYT
jgi:hypothetical protein